MTSGVSFSQFDLQRAAGAFAAHARVQDRAQRADNRSRHRLGNRALAWGLFEDGYEEGAQHLRVARPALDADRPGRTHLHRYQARRVWAVAGGFEQRAHDRVDLQRPLLLGVVGSDDPRGQPPDQLVVRRQQALLLVLEVLVEAAPRHARSSDQIGDRGRHEAALVDRLDRGLIQALALVGCYLLWR